MGSSTTVRPLAGYHCTCALINWLVLRQCPRSTCWMMVRPVDGPRTIIGKEGYRAENAPTAHLGLGIRRLAHLWVHSRSEAPLERGVERDGPTSGQYPGARAPRASRPTFESWSVLNPWVFLKKWQQALRTGRTDPRTIWIGRQESGISHQLTDARPP